MIKNIAKHELFIIVGFFMAVLTLVKIFGVYEFSSDWLWFIAGMGLIVEGSISLTKQRLFDQKYRVVLRD
jgi:hypothetical protein